jgi:hypothetical protein
MRTIEELRADMVKVLELRSSGKKLTPEQEVFAKNIVDEMLDMRMSKQVGVQLISRAKLDFIKGQQPVQDSNAVGGIVQDVVANVTTKDGKFPRKFAAEPSAESTDVAKADIKGCKCKELPISGADSGKDPRHSPDAESIKLNPPENQAEGAITSTADIIAEESVTQPEATDVKTEVPSEKIGHQPNEPMPKSQAIDLLNNAKWGVEIGAYVSVKEGIERLLGRKEYAEFTDTTEKVKEVQAYLVSLIPEAEATAVNS